MALIEAPVLLDRQPQPPHRLESEVQRLDRAGLEAGIALVEVETLGRHQFAGSFRFCDALLGQVDVPPSCEAIFEVPRGLTMADKDERRHHFPFLAARRE